jgi:hypothetical protein
MSGLDYSVTTPTHAMMPNQRPFMEFRLGEAHISSDDLISGPSGVVGVLGLVALGFALWYHKKYHQALTGNWRTPRMG